MTDESSSTPAPTRDRYAIADADEPIRVPSWMREPEVEHELTRSERLRLVWEIYNGRLLVGVVVLTALSLVAFLAFSGVTFGQRLHDAEPLLPGRAMTPPAGPRPTDESGNSLGPFVATPAESFAEGEAAIVLPAARAAGPFTARQVADALAAVKRALVQGRVERRMLYGDPDRFLAELAPGTRSDVRQEMAEGGGLAYVTRIAEDADPDLEARENIRARGTIEYRATTDSQGIRVLEITTRFIWVYPFDLWLPQKHRPGAELVTLRDEVVWHLPHPRDVQAEGRGLWIESAVGTVQNGSCPAMKRGFLALAGREPLGRRTAPAPTGNVYDDNWRPGAAGEC